MIVQFEQFVYFKFNRHVLYFRVWNHLSWIVCKSMTLSIWPLFDLFLIILNYRPTCIWRQSSLDFNQSDLLTDQRFKMFRNLGPNSNLVTMSLLTRWQCRWSEIQILNAFFISYDVKPMISSPMICMSWNRHFISHSDQTSISLSWLSWLSLQKYQEIDDPSSF